MALYGSAVPWWRVVRSDGTLLPAHELRALDHYRAEGTPLREASHRAEGHIPRIDMRRARWDGGGQAEAEPDEGCEPDGPGDRGDRGDRGGPGGPGEKGHT